jgi:cytochrome c oxidase subunit 2
VNGFPPLMPTFQGVVSEEQIAQLTAYIKSLSGTGAAGTGSTGAGGAGSTGTTAPAAATPAGPAH